MRSCLFVVTVALVVGVAFAGNGNYGKCKECWKNAWETACGMHKNNSLPECVVNLSMPMENCDEPEENRKAWKSYWDAWKSMEDKEKRNQQMEDCKECMKEVKLNMEGTCEKCDEDCWGKWMEPPRRERKGKGEGDSEKEEENGKEKET